MTNAKLGASVRRVNATQSPILKDVKVSNALGFGTSELTEGRVRLGSVHLTELSRSVSVLNVLNTYSYDRTELTSVFSSVLRSVEMTDSLRLQSGVFV